jgi:biotin transport system substrate-specific component
VLKERRAPASGRRRLSASAITRVALIGRRYGGSGLLGPTGGHLVSYPAAAVAGLAAPVVAGGVRRRALVFGVLRGCVGLAVIYALGATRLAVVTDLPAGIVLVQGVLIFVPFDLIKVSLAALVAVAAAPAVGASRS